jgi:hypothetical protein
MPQILVVTDPQDDADRTVVYRERISVSDLDSDHFSGQLVERVGWATVDAEELEQGKRLNAFPSSARSAGQSP